MEDVKKLLEENGTLMNTLEENDSDCESLSIWDSRIAKDVSFANDTFLEMKRFNSVTTKKRNGEKRLPTRRPDPNVYNRNALLARENRRKKKEYLATIEKELKVAQKVNRALAKALKQQLKIAQNLEKEKRYFESLVKKNTDILTFNALNFHQIPASEASPLSTGSNQEDYIYDMSELITTRSPVRADPPSIEFDSPSDGSVAAPIPISFSDFSTYDFFAFPNFPDLDYDTDTCLPTHLGEIWGDSNIDDLITTNIKVLENNEFQSCINDDYAETTSSNSVETYEHGSESSDYIDVEENCTHIKNFCSSNNCSYDCGVPPLQLLSEQS